MIKRSKNASYESVDSFGTFLASVQQQFTPGPAPYRLVSLLSQNGPTSLPEAMTASGLPFDEFAEGLRTLQTAGFVLITSPSPGNEIIALTPGGERLANAQEGRI
jgi:hypothetical protein